MAKPKKQENIADKTPRFYNDDPQLPVGDHQYEWTEEMIDAMDRCETDIIYFAENFYHILTEEGEQVIKLREYQKRTLLDIANHRFYIMLSPRQSGKTTTFGILALHMACFNNNKRILITANKGETATETFTRIKDAYIAMPNWLKPSVKFIGKTHLELANGSTINITRTSTSMGRGKSIDLVILDEMAFIENHLMEEAWRSIYPVISRPGSKAKILCSSTPKGTKNLFYEIWHKATVGGDSSWGHQRVYWQEIEGRDEEWKRKTIIDIGSVERFNQEFGCEFFETSSSGLDPDTEFHIKQTIKPPLETMEDGRYKVWDTPKLDRLYLAGVDVSDGIGKDNSVIQIIDITDINRIEQVAEYADNTMDPFSFTAKVNEILLQWGRPLCAVERNGIGAEVVSRLDKDYKYPHLLTFIGSGYGDAAASRANMYGVHCTTVNKGIGNTNYRYWLNTQKQLIIRSEEYFKEAGAFIKHPSGAWKAMDGYCDDRVMAMIWALIALENKICEKYFEIQKYDRCMRPAKVAPTYKSRVITDSNNNPVVFGNKSTDYKYNPSFFGVGGQIFSNSDIMTDIDELKALGYVVPEPTKHTILNRYGVDMGYMIN